MGRGVEGAETELALDVDEVFGVVDIAGTLVCPPVLWGRCTLSPVALLALGTGI